MPTDTPPPIKRKPKSRARSTAKGKALPEARARRKGSRKRSAAALKVKIWVLYVLRCQDETLYCGITNDMARRLAQHNSGKGARYTKGRGPLVVLKSWPAASLSAALKAERAFKALSKAAKLLKLRSRSRRDAVSVLLRGL